MTATTHLPTAERINLLVLTSRSDREAYDAGEREGLGWAPAERDEDGFLCFAKVGGSYGFAYEPQDGEANAVLDGDLVWIEGLHPSAGYAYGEYIRIPGNYEV
jgi:hypothetical protein